MAQNEFQKRCESVFDSKEGDEYYSIDVDCGVVSVAMSEPDGDVDNPGRVYFSYSPDMSERPEALDYLLGNRDDFAD